MILLSVALWTFPVGANSDVFDNSDVLITPTQPRVVYFILLFSPRFLLLRNPDTGTLSGLTQCQGRPRSLVLESSGYDRVTSKESVGPLHTSGSGTLGTLIRTQADQEES